MDDLNPFPATVCPTQILPKVESERNGGQRSPKSGASKQTPSSDEPSPLPAKPPEADATADFGAVNILLVDDTPENLVALEAVLQDLGQNIVKASSGEEALRLLLRQSFAVIILDVNMPGMNGFETANLIRQRKSSEHTPIIFVTAISTSEMHMHQGYALGAVDYIFTPVIPEVLRSKVAVFVDLLRKTDEVRRQAEQIRRIQDEEHRRRLNETEERLVLETKRNRFFNLSIDMLGIAGFDGYYRELNPSWKSVFGFADEELKAKPLLEFVPKEERKRVGGELDRIKRSGRPASFESRFLCKDGGVRWLSWTIAPFAAEDLLYLFARDITQRKTYEDRIQKLNVDLERRARELEKANKELEIGIQERKKAESALKETNAELESFSYSVSHDLRAPLRSMQAFAEALLDDEDSGLSETAKDFASRIIGAGNRMEALIQDLLVYSRISQSEQRLQKVRPDEVLDEALAQLEAPLRETGAEVEIVPPFSPLVGHYPTLIQIFTNLVSNAIKFMREGVKPHVRIRMERAGTFGRLWFEDNGIGIEPEHFGRIFRVFERLHGIDSYPGTGIGLAIVRKGVERMGGRLGVESGLGKGSRFWIDLPLAKDGAASSKTAASN